MVQVIQLHPYKQSYPFGLEKQSDCTYVELIKEITSETQLFTYKQNLALFKSLQSDLVIPLDSYIKQGNTLQLYYQYQPLSIKHYIQQRLVMMPQDQQRDKFLTRVITSINVAIEDVITLMMGKKIMALLSIENMAIGKEERIKFFIEPDFEFVEKPMQNQLVEYYTTEKKKLQIQLEEFLEHIFSYTNSKPKDHGKANFVIQGTKLVFVNEQENRQSSMSGVSVIPGTTSTTTTTNNNNPTTSITTSTSTNNNNITTPSTTNSGIIHQQIHQIKLPAYMLKQPKQTKQLPQQQNINNSSKQKFDIKNILDEKKLQKNQPQLKENVGRGHGGEMLDKCTNKNSFTENSDDVSGKNEKDVKNYFENNDDFNKDASFYPEEFIKEDSIAEFQGYEDQLQKELQDLKNKKYQAQQLANTSKNRLSMVPNTPINPQLTDQQQKMNKSPNPQQGQSLAKPSNQQFPQNVLNSSDSRQNDTSQEQLKQKKKYKVTITTSHLVDVDDEEADLRTIEQELIEDIKKGGGLKHSGEGNGGKQQQQQQVQNVKDQSKGNNNNSNNNSDKEIISSPNIPTHLLKPHTRDTHTTNTSSTHQPFPPHSNTTNSQSKPTSLLSTTLASTINQQHAQQQRPFSKQPHPHMSSQTATYSSLGVNKEFSSNVFTHGGNSTTSNQQAPDIKKIIEKIKNNSQNHQFINSTAGLTQAPMSGQNNNNAPIVKPQTISHKEQPIHSTVATTTIVTQKPLQQQQQQDTRPHSQLSSQGVTNSSSNPQNSQKKEQEKEYYDKIQKAKMKAEEIMKLVKERKGQ